MNRESDDKQTTFATESVLAWLLVAIGFYLLPFVAVVIDEIVLKTFWFSRHLPDWVGDIMRAIYPFHRLFH